MKTEYDDSATHVFIHDWSIYVGWPDVKKKYHLMIYFLGVYDAKTKEDMFGVYTREVKMSWPSMREAVLFVSDKKEVHFEEGREYVARLLAVDYHGWVPIVSEERFIYKQWLG